MTLINDDEPVTVAHLQRAVDAVLAAMTAQLTATVNAALAEVSDHIEHLRASAEAAINSVLTVKSIRSVQRDEDGNITTVLEWE